MPLNGRVLFRHEGCLNFADRPKPQDAQNLFLRWYECFPHLLQVLWLAALFFLPLLGVPFVISFIPPRLLHDALTFPLNPQQILTFCGLGL